MKKFLEAVLAKHKHMAKTASPHHPHSQALVYTPGGKEEIRPIDTADAGYGGEAVVDAQGGEANAGKASKKAVSPMKMQTLVKANEETERERLQKLRSFAHQQKLKGLGKVMVEDEQIDELKKSTLASYAKKATDDVSYHSFTAGGMSAKDPERLAQDKKAMKRQTGVIKAIDRLAKEEVEQVEEGRLRRSMRGYAVLGGYGGNSQRVRYQSSGERSREINVGLDDKQERENARRAAEAGKAKMNKEEVEQVDETRRMSAAEKLGRAFDSEQQKSADSRRRAQEYMTKIRADVDAKMKKDKEGIKEENNGTEADEGEYGYEGDMAMSQLKSIIRNAKGLHDLLEPQTDLPEWVQSKITLAADYIQTAADYWRSEKEEAMSEGKAEDEKAARAADVLGGPVKPKSSVIGGPGQPKSARNLAMRLATKAMKAGRSVSEEKKSKVPRIGEMEKALEEEVWDKPMPDSKKQGSLSAEQKAKAKARADRAGRSYPNMIDNMWASKQ